MLLGSHWVYRTCLGNDTQRVRVRFRLSSLLARFIVGSRKREWVSVGVAQLGRRMILVPKNRFSIEVGRWARIKSIKRSRHARVNSRASPMNGHCRSRWNKSKCEKSARNEKKERKERISRALQRFGRLVTSARRGASSIPGIATVALEIDRVPFKISWWKNIIDNDSVQLFSLSLSLLPNSITLVFVVYFFERRNTRVDEM